MKKQIGMTEVDCYRARYGSLIYNVEHYKSRMGWMHFAASFSMVADEKKKMCYINGELVPPCTFEWWVKFNDKPTGR
jgi:hypothetical protein